MAERLTKRISKYKGKGIYVSTVPFGEEIQALGRYEDLIEQGRLIDADEFKNRFFCELNNIVVRPILYTRKLEPQFTIYEIQRIFDEVVEQMKGR